MIDASYFTVSFRRKNGVRDVGVVGIKSLGEDFSAFRLALLCATIEEYGNDVVEVEYMEDVPQEIKKAVD